MLWQYFDGDIPSEGVECRWGMQKSRFSNTITFYLGNNKDRAVVTIKCKWELVCDLSNGAIFNDQE